MTFTAGQQETINNTDKEELLKIHELLKKHGVSYISRGCLPLCYYVLKFDFKKMKWKCERGEGFYSDQIGRMHNNDEVLDDDYNPETRINATIQGPIPAYAVEKFARKIFFVKDLPKNSFDINEYKIDLHICDASGSDASVLGKEFTWIPAAIGGYGDITSSAYSIFPSKESGLKEQLTERIKADFFNQIAKAIFELYDESLCYKDYVDKKLEQPNREVNPNTSICKNYINNYISEIEKRALNREAGAVYHLANLYDYGVFVPENKEKAASLYIKAARLGNINAIQHVVQLYKEETISLSAASLTADEFKIWQYYVDREDEERNSEYILGQWYELQGNSDSIDAALKWYDVAAHSGNEEANFKLGCWYLLGKNVEQDFEKAAEYFSDCAFEKCLYAAQLVFDSGIAISQEKVQLFLGRLYSYAVEKIARESEEFDSIEDTSLSVADPLKNALKKGYAKEAIAWLKKAAAQNNAAAMTGLYDLYMNDSLTEYDSKTAIQWIEKAAYLNDNDAILKIAHYYVVHDDKTISKEKRFERAKYWFSKLPYSTQYEDEYYLYTKIYHQSMVYSVVDAINLLAIKFAAKDFNLVIDLIRYYNQNASNKTIFLLKDIVPYIAENRKDYIEVLCEHYSTNSLTIINNDLKMALSKL